MSEHTRAADLTICDQEQIQFLGSIQPHAFVIEVSADWLVTRASANLDLFLPISAEAALGQPASDVLGRMATHEIRGQLQIGQVAQGVSRLLSVAVGSDAFDFAVHRSGGVTVIEGERPVPGDGDMLPTLQPLVLQLRRIKDIGRLLTQAARQVRALTGFDRVMVYQFQPDGSGEVIAETKRTELPPFKGLRYPASDIPRQARALYEVNPIRLIADVEAPSVPILPALNPEGAPIDLSLAGARAVSPIHIEYLKNMAVGASMSLSLLVSGKLWGLIACHHRTPRLLSLRARASLEFFGHYLSAILETRLLAATDSRREAARVVHADILAALAGETSTLEDLFPQLKSFQALIEADGFVTYVDGRLRFFGAVPDDRQTLELMRFLNRASASRVYATHTLSQAFPEAVEYAATVSGLLAIPVSRKPRDFVVFFRKELVQHVSWAGDPNKSVVVSGAGGRIGPRKSFEAWRETVRGQSTHWSDSDIDLAEALRVALIEFMLQVVDRAEKQRRISSEQQDLLIAELNHRVRNILNLIVGLVRQVAESAADVGSFSREIMERVHALARAHDQLTSSGWGARSVINMIRVEAAAYLADRAQRVRITGGDIYVQPNAFATLALVIHELMTNAVKYGSFRDSNGAVEITLAHEDSAFTIDWRELGGAPVKEPTRRGFGSTIIQRAVPHELSGTASMRFDPTGLQVRLSIPATFMAEEAYVPPQEVEPEPVATPQVDRLCGSVLLVEDNLLIALETEDALYILGAEDVHIASTVAGALAYLRDSRPDFAVLDYNLGSDSSVAIAEQLLTLGVPFVLATGYGDASVIDPRLRSRPIILKPFTANSLLHAFNEAIAASSRRSARADAAEVNAAT